MAEERPDDAIVVVPVRPNVRIAGVFQRQAGRDLERESGQLSRSDRPIQPFLRRDPAEERQIVAAAGIERQALDVDGVVDRRQPAGVG